MAYTTTKLITNAYYASGIVSRDFETVSGPQFASGLQFLNELIADKTVDNASIPYYLKYTFNGVIGQEAYPIADLIEVETLVFFIDTVRYQMNQLGRDIYFGSSRANNINSLPFSYHVERTFEGATIYMYFKPDSNYLFELWGQFRLSSVVIGQDLSLTLDQFYINYLRYQLAQRLCNEYNFEVPVNVATQVAKYEGLIAKKSSPMDLHITTTNTVGDTRGSINYGIVNLSRGWVPN